MKLWQLRTSRVRHLTSSIFLIPYPVYVYVTYTLLIFMAYLPRYASDFLFGPQYRLYSCELKTTLVLNVCLRCLDLSSNKQVFVG